MLVSLIFSVVPTDGSSVGDGVFVKKINSENENEGISEVKGHTGGHLLDILSYSVK